MFAVILVINMIIKYIADLIIIIVQAFCSAYNGMILSATV